MNDHVIAVALRHAVELEQTARECFEQSGEADERELAIGVVRLVAPLRRGLEKWMLARATRSLLKT